MAQRSEIKARLALLLGGDRAANYGPNGRQVEAAMAFAPTPFIDTDNPA